MNTANPDIPDFSNPELYRFLRLLTEDERAGRLHFNLRYLLAYLPEPDYRSGMPAEYPAELPEDISILLTLLDMAARDPAAAAQLRGAVLQAGARQSLDTLIRFLITTIRPEKIFLLSHPLKDQEAPPYTELILVMPDNSPRPFSSIEQVIDIGCIHNHQVHSTILLSADLNRKILEGDLYYGSVCSKSRMVYDDGKILLPSLPLKQLNTMYEKAIAVFTTGHMRAAGFLEAAAHQQRQELVAFMLQQSAELTYRTVTLALTGFDPRSHSFDVLKKHLRRCAPELIDMLPVNTPQDEKLMQLLESAYLNARYKDSYLITPEELYLLKERVEKLHTRARIIFEQQVETLYSSASTIE